MRPAGPQLPPLLMRNECCKNICPKSSFITQHVEGTHLPYDIATSLHHKDGCLTITILRTTHDLAVPRGCSLRLTTAQLDNAKLRKRTTTVNEDSKRGAKHWLCIMNLPGVFVHTSVYLHAWLEHVHMEMICPWTSNSVASVISSVAAVSQPLQVEIVLLLWVQIVHAWSALCDPSKTHERAGTPTSMCSWSSDVGSGPDTEAQATNLFIATILVPGNDLER
mmetsp:Transcript_37060/g.71255  ORF Transcript_37060/g.71255 Transcript_37060/m.71255 type:complete len:222 (-) Transcript_37060:314-979(-)